MAEFKIDDTFYKIEMDLKSGDWHVITEKLGETPQRTNCGNEIDTALLFVLKDYIIA